MLLQLLFITIFVYAEENPPSSSELVTRIEQIDEAMKTKINDLQDAHTKDVEKFTQQLSTLEKQVKSLPRLDEIKTTTRQIKSEIKKLKSTVRKVDDVSTSIQQIIKLQEEQAEKIAELKTKQKVEYDELKQSLKDDIKGEFSGFFTSIAVEVDEMGTLIRNSYIFVIYDVSKRLGFKESDVDFIFEQMEQYFNLMYAKVVEVVDIIMKQVQDLWELAKVHVPVYYATFSERTSQYTETASTKFTEFATVAGDKFSTFSTVAGEHATVYGNAASEFLSAQMEEMQKVDPQEFMDKAQTKARNAFENLKSNPDVQSTMKTAFSKVGVEFEEKSQEDVDLIMNVTLMSIIGTVVLFGLTILFSLLRSLCRCCCGSKKRKIIPTPSVNVPKEEEKSAPATTSTPKKQKKSKKKKQK